MTEWLKRPLSSKRISPWLERRRAVQKSLWARRECSGAIAAGIVAAGIIGTTGADGTTGIASGACGIDGAIGDGENKFVFAL